MRMLVSFAGCLAVVVAGCTDEVDLGGASSGAGGQGSGGDSVTFIVVVESVFADPSAPPREGATVSFDAPGGARVEKVTGADGKVTFTGIDWSKGKAAATAYLEGYGLWSSVNLDEARLAKVRRIDDAVALQLFDPAAPETVTVQGTFTGILDGEHGGLVNVVHADIGSEWIGPSTGTFQVSVPKGAPFTLQAGEVTAAATLSGQGENLSIHQLMHQSFPATMVDLTGVVLDFAVGAPPVQPPVVVSVATPKRADSPVRAGRGASFVFARNSYSAIGYSTHIDISTDKNHFDATLAWIEPSWAEDPFYVVRVHQGPQVISQRLVMGWPKAGPIGTLPDTPVWVTPADTSGKYPLHDAIEWKLFDADVPHLIFLLGGANPYAWQIDPGADATTLTVPQPPSPVDVATVLGTSLRGTLNALWLNDTTIYPVEAFSTSQGVLFEP